MQVVRFKTGKQRQTWGWIDPDDDTRILEPLGMVDIAPDGLIAAVGRGLADHLATLDAVAHDRAAIRLLAPVERPSKIIGVGRNYRAHAAESGSSVPDSPMLFGILPSAISGPFDDIVLPRQTRKLDWEGELGVIIGKRARHVNRSDALAYIAGYTVLNDVSARDLQRHDGQWTRAKSFDTFKPIGPCLVTVDELGTASDLRITVRVNGELMQDARTAMMVFPIDELVEYASAFCTLLPGDIIATGTPEGVGFGRTPELYLDVGDVVETEIEGIGMMINRVVAPSMATEGF